MGLTINKSVQTAAGAATGTYLRLEPTLLISGMVLQVMVLSYFQKSTFDENLQTIAINDVALQSCYTFLYNRQNNGVDLLQLAQTWTKQAIIEANDGWTSDDITEDTLN